MSLARFKQLIEGGKFICPECSRAITKFEKFVETSDSIWDGAGDSATEATGSKVTLICGNESCKWTERTEYWDSYLAD